MGLFLDEVTSLSLGWWCLFWTGPWIANVYFSHSSPGPFYCPLPFSVPLRASTHKLTGRSSTCLPSPLEFYWLGSVLGLVGRAWRLPRGRGGGRLGTQAGAGVAIPGRAGTFAPRGVYGRRGEGTLTLEAAGIRVGVTEKQSFSKSKEPPG